MTNDFRMSFFMPPIAPIRNKQGKIITPATLTPFCEISVEQLYRMLISSENLKVLTEQVRNSENIQIAKTTLLPYVTPCGTFTRRSSKCFISPSGLTVVDIDQLHSYQEASEMSQTLFNDPLLQPVLTFISPSGLGVKALVPYNQLCLTDEEQNIKTNIRLAMQYIEMAYGPEVDVSIETAAKVVDISGKDIVRSCFLSHDPYARLRKSHLSTY